MGAGGSYTANDESPGNPARVSMVEQVAALHAQQLGKGR